MIDEPTMTLAKIELVLAYKEGRLTAEQLGRAIRELTAQAAAVPQEPKRRMSYAEQSREQWEQFSRVASELEECRQQYDRSDAKRSGARTVERSQAAIAMATRERISYREALRRLG